MRSVRKGDWKKVQHSAHIQLDYWLRGKESACNAGNTGGSGSIPQSGRSPGKSNGYPFHYLAWRIPWTEEPGGLQSMGLQRVRLN